MPHSQKVTNTQRISASCQHHRPDGRLPLLIKMNSRGTPQPMVSFLAPNRKIRTSKYAVVVLFAGLAAVLALVDVRGAAGSGPGDTSGVTSSAPDTRTKAPLPPHYNMPFGDN